MPIDEKERLERAKKNKEKFTYTPKQKSLKLVKEVKLKGVSFDFDLKRFRELQCYLYHFGNLGITSENMREEFEGKTLLIYKFAGVTTKRTKCPWCYAPQEHLLTHIHEAHNKNELHLQYLKFQELLYKELLRIIRDTPHYFATMFLNAGCQLCDNPITEGRELCCSIPTSFRDRARSLAIMGFDAKSIKDKKLIMNPNYGQIILAP